MLDTVKFALGSVLVLIAAGAAIVAGALVALGLAVAGVIAAATMRYRVRALLWHAPHHAVIDGHYTVVKPR
jgi:hypothetical protein